MALSASEMDMIAERLCSEFWTNNTGTGTVIVIAILTRMLTQMLG
jgi:hypothetical protein